MKKRLLSFGLVLCMLMSCVPMAMANTDTNLSYVELEEDDTGYAESSGKETGDLEVQTNGSACIALYDGADKVGLFDSTGNLVQGASVSGNLKVELLESDKGILSATHHYEITFKEITETQPGTITYNGKTLTVVPVQPKFGFYTDRSCTTASLVEDIDAPAKDSDTVLYFYWNKTDVTAQDYDDITFEFDGEDLSKLTKSTVVPSDSSPACMVLTLAYRDISNGGTLEALKGTKTVAEAEIGRTSAAKPNYSFCTYDGDEYKEISALVLDENTTSVDVYVMEDEEDPAANFAVSWSDKSGNNASLSVSSSTTGADGKITLTRSTSDAFSGTLTATDGTNICSLRVSFTPPAPDIPAPSSGFYYRLTNGKDREPTGDYLQTPLELTYGESIYLAFYNDGALLTEEQVETMESEGVSLGSYSKTGAVRVIPERQETGWISYTKGSNTSTIGVQTVPPETGFYFMPQQTLAYYLDHLALLTAETTVYFIGAEDGDTATFTSASPSLFTVSPASVDAKNADPIPVKLTALSSDPDDYADDKNALKVTASIKGKDPAEISVSLSDSFGDMAAYGFYTLENGQYDKTNDLTLNASRLPSDRSSSVYLIKKDFAAFTQAELGTLDISFIADDSTSQNAASLTTSLMADGTVRIKITFQNDRNLAGKISVKIGSEEIAWLRVAIAQKVFGTMWRESFALEDPASPSFNEDAWYQIGFVDGSVSGTDTYLALLGKSWSRNSELDNEDPEEDPFYVGIVLGDEDGAPKARPNVYKDLIKSITYSLADSGSDTIMPSIKTSTHDQGWDMVTIQTYLKNAGTWQLNADIELNQTIWLGDDDEYAPVTSFRLTLLYSRTLVPEIKIDLREEENLLKDASGDPMNALETVQAYIDLLETNDGLEEIITLWRSQDRNDWVEVIQKEDSELWFTLPAETYTDDLVADQLVRQVGVSGTEDDKGNVTTIVGSVYRALDEGNDPDSATLALSDLYLKSPAHSNKQQLLDSAVKDPTYGDYNYGVYSAGGNIEIEGCTFEGYYAAVWDAPLENMSSKD